MVNKEYKIEIIVRDEDGEIVCRGQSLSFEGAEEDLGKLEKYVEKVEHDDFMSEDEE